MIRHDLDFLLTGIKVVFNIHHTGDLAEIGFHYVSKIGKPCQIFTLDAEFDVVAHRSPC